MKLELELGLVLVMELVVVLARVVLGLEEVLELVAEKELAL